MRPATSKQLRLFLRPLSSICHNSRYIPQQSDEEMVRESFPDSRLSLKCLDLGWCKEGRYGVSVAAGLSRIVPTSGASQTTNPPSDTGGGRVGPDLARITAEDRCRQLGLELSSRFIKPRPSLELLYFCHTRRYNVSTESVSYRF